MDPGFEGNKAFSLLKAGRNLEAAQLFRQICAQTHIIDQQYNRLVRGLAQSLSALGRYRDAAYINIFLGQFNEAQVQATNELPIHRARIMEQASMFGEAARLYQEQDHHVLAAIAHDLGGQDELARACWERARNDQRLKRHPYEEALVYFNLGYCCRTLQDDKGHTHLVTAQRLLEEVADEFETAGQRERAFDCYQILLEMGRRSGAFENMAEGYLNCIRILKEDNLKYYVLQYYEDFLREALDQEEFHAAASLFREAADYCLRMGLLYDQHYLQSSAETWLKAADKNMRESGPPELAENAYLAAVACYNTLGDYYMVGQTYRLLGELNLAPRKKERYQTITDRYRDTTSQAPANQHFPEQLKKTHAYPEIWRMDLVEWEHDGDAGAVCAAVIGDTGYPDVVRRRALDVLLDWLEPEMSLAQLAQVAEKLGNLQIYVVLRPLERLFENDSLEIQRGVMRALRFLFFKRSFGLLRKGLASDDNGVRLAAIEALGRLYFNHAFDPLVRIFRESQDPEVRSTALESIGRIPSLEAGDFLIEILRYEAEPLRSLAKRLLATFENRDLVPILHQHYQMETGDLRTDLAQILQQRGVAV